MSNLGAAVVKYSYNPQEANCLSLEEGARVDVIQLGDPWTYCYFNGNLGYFPTSYLDFSIPDLVSSSKTPQQEQMEEKQQEQSEDPLAKDTNVQDNAASAEQSIESQEIRNIEEATVEERIQEPDAMDDQNSSPESTNPTADDTITEEEQPSETQPQQEAHEEDAQSSPDQTVEPEVILNENPISEPSFSESSNSIVNATEPKEEQPQQSDEVNWAAIPDNLDNENGGDDMPLQNIPSVYIDGFSNETPIPSGVTFSQEGLGIYNGKIVETGETGETEIPVVAPMEMEVEMEMEMEMEMEGKEKGVSSETRDIRSEGGKVDNSTQEVENTPQRVENTTQEEESTSLEGDNSTIEEVNSTLEEDNATQRVDNSTQEVENTTTKQLPPRIEFKIPSPQDETPPIETPITQTTRLIHSITSDGGNRIADTMSNQVMTMIHTIIAGDAMSNKAQISGTVSQSHEYSSFLTEFTTEENRYYNNLVNLYQYFFKNIEYSNTPEIRDILSYGEMGVLMQSLRQILDVHNNLLYQLEKTNLSKASSFLSLFSLFISLLSPYVYYASVTTFCSNVIEENMERKAFRNFCNAYRRVSEKLAAFAGEKTRSSIFDVLISPMKRILTYFQYFETLRDFLHSTHDRSMISQCSTQLKGLLESINNAMQEHDSLVKMTEISEKLSIPQIKANSALLAHGRTLFLNDDLTCECSDRSKSGDYYVIVCNDVILFCKRSKDKFSLKHMYRTKIAELSPQTETPTPDDEVLEYPISLHVDQKSEKWELIFESPTSMYYWRNILTQVLDAARHCDNPSIPAGLGMSRHSFSSPHSMFYSPVAVDGHHFSRKRPASMSSPSVESPREKECPACGQKISFRKTECGECRRAFCSQCCVQRILKAETMEFKVVCDECYMILSMQEESVDNDCFSSHQALLQNIKHTISAHSKEKPNPAIPNTARDLVPHNKPKIASIEMEGNVDSMQFIKTQFCGIPPEVSIRGRLIRCGWFGLMQKGQLTERMLVIFLFSQLLLIGQLKSDGRMGENGIYEYVNSYVLSEVGIAAKKNDHEIDIL